MAMSFSFKKIFPRRGPSFIRTATRYTCQLDAMLLVIDRMLTYEGRLIDMSIGGAMFRPRLAYLMDRRDVPVCLTVGGLEVYGRIIATTPQGFGLRFDEPIEEEEILTLLKSVAPKQTDTWIDIAAEPA